MLIHYLQPNVAASLFLDFLPIEPLKEISSLIKEGTIWVQKCFKGMRGVGGTRGTILIYKKGIKPEFNRHLCNPPPLYVTVKQLKAKETF